MHGDGGQVQGTGGLTLGKPKGAVWTVGILRLGVGGTVDHLPTLGHAGQGARNDKGGALEKVLGFTGRRGLVRAVAVGTGLRGRG